MIIDPFITENIIALCYIIDEFEEFKKRLLPMIETEFNREFISQLWYASNGYFKIGARKARKFYKENSAIIDMINEYSHISRFICSIWDSKGQPKEDFQRIYQYILKHKDQINEIIAVLVRINELGFVRFDFDDTIDFTKETYNCSLLFRANSSMNYIDNIKIVSSSPDSVTYKTLDSNYKIDLAIDEKGISVDKRKIILNSLLFNPDRLPGNYNIVNAFNNILYLYYEYTFQKLTEQLLTSKNEGYTRKLNLNKEEK